MSFQYFTEMKILFFFIFRITNSNKKNPGDILISCGQTMSTTEASIKFTCDKNANGIEDEGELEIFKTYTLTADGTCSRKNKVCFELLIIYDS